MEELIKVIADNGVAVASFIALLFFIFTDKKQSNENMKLQIDNQKETNRVLDEISKTLVQLSERVATLEKTKNKKKGED